MDVVEDHFGFRSFRFDADSGFYIHGKAVKLIGANRHQDFPEKGNALDNARHYQDLQLLKDMGRIFSVQLTILRIRLFWMPATN